MPSTYSTNLKLELMATGENSGTWGTKTNNNLFPLVEQAIVSQADVSMLDATTTITMLDGASCDARCLVLDLTGVLTEDRNLVVPTIQKPYIVANNTTGGYAVTVKTSAGTGISVPNGDRMFLYADGTNVVEMLSEGAGSFTSLAVSGAATIGTTLGVTGATTLSTVTATSVNKVAITAPASNATLTIANGKTLTASNTLTFTGTDGTSFAFPSTSGTVVTLTEAQTLTNKTLTAPVISTISNTGTLTLPTSTDTLVGRETTDTLTNKTLTSPTINTGALGASSTATTQTAGDNSTKLATTAYVDTLRVSGARDTDALAANVNMLSTGTYYTGPELAQGSTGTWFVSGTVTVANGSGGDVVNVKLWDGTTVLASCRMHLVSVAGTYYGVAALSGYITSPAGNLRISVSPVSRTEGYIAYNVSGNEKDSTLSAFRIA